MESTYRSSSFVAQKIHLQFAHKIFSILLRQNSFTPRSPRYKKQKKENSTLELDKGVDYYCTSICARSCCTWRTSSVDSKQKQKTIKATKPRTACPPQEQEILTSRDHVSDLRSYDEVSDLLGTPKQEVWWQHMCAYRQEMLTSCASMYFFYVSPCEHCMSLIFPMKIVTPPTPTKSRTEIPRYKFTFQHISNLICKARYRKT